MCQVWGAGHTCNRPGTRNRQQVAECRARWWEHPGHLAIDPGVMFEEDVESKVLRYCVIAVVAVAGLWLAGYLIRDGQNKADQKAVEQVLRSMSEEAQRKNAQARREAAMQKAAAEAAAEARAREEQRRHAAAAQARRAAEARERAWAAHYKPPRECENPGDDWNAQVECANHYMRARKAFDASYVPGR